MAKASKQTKKFLSKGLKKESNKIPKWVKEKRAKDEAAVEAPENSEGELSDDSSDDQVGFIGGAASDVSDEDESEGEGESMEGESGDELDDTETGSELEEEEEEDEDLELNMQELKEKDPKFYQYLLDNDKDLLQFKDVNDAVDEDTEMTESIENLVTKEMIHNWRASISKSNSIKTLKKIILAFRAAAAFGEEDEQELRYRVVDQKVFNLIILTAIKYSPLVLNHYLYGEGTVTTDTAKKSLPSGVKKWKNVNSLVKSFLTSLLKILQKMTSLSMTKFVIKTTEASISYFACFPKLCKDFLKEMLSLWCSSAHEQVRVLAFLCIRKLALVAPNPYLDMTLKRSYQTFLSSVRVTNAHTYAQIQFMDNCIVELSGLFLASTYQHAFVALRQLAIQLRQASTTKTQENYKSVYNWQYLHALRLWAHVLTTYNIEQDPKQQLKPLIYPLVQIVIGVMRLKPSSKHFPLRLALIKILIGVSEKTGVYIPVASYLFEVFESAELKGKPKPSTLKPLDFSLNIRAPNQYLGSKTYHTGLVDQVLELLFHFYATQATSIAFPELAIPAIIQLRRILKAGKDVGMSRQIQQLIEKLEQNSTFVEKHRNQVTYGPKEIEKAIAFLSTIGKSQAPLYKHFEARLKVQARIPKTEMAVVEEGDSSDDETPKEKIEKAKAASNSRVSQLTGDEDLVEDFELSEEEEDE